MSTNEYREEYIILADAFYHAIDGLNEDAKAEALEIMKYILGKEVSEGNYLFPIVTGFCMGFKEATRIWDILNDAGEGK